MSCKHGFPTDVMHCDLCCGEELRQVQNELIELAHESNRVRRFVPPASAEKLKALIGRALMQELLLKQKDEATKKEWEEWEKIKEGSVPATKKKAKKPKTPTL